MKVQKRLRMRYHGMMFINDIVLVGENLEEVNNRLDE
jgi:hypothetical protein